MIQKSKSFVVKRANGVDDFRIQLRESYVRSIRSEKKLREVLVRSIAGFSSLPYRESLLEKYTAGQLLEIMRIFGMIGGSERLTKNGGK
jgi:hypothetical protein